MNIIMFRNKIDLIHSFAVRMNNEIIPQCTQKIMIKVYASTLNINLTDRMIDDFMFIHKNTHPN